MNRDDKAIIKELEKMAVKMEKLELIMERLEAKIDDSVSVNCKKMGEHIDFVEDVYDNMRSPMQFMMNKIKGWMPGRREAIELPVSNTIANSNADRNTIQMCEFNQTIETDTSFTTNLEINLSAHQVETEPTYEGEVTQE
jgi:hypothetical protein